ncbi:MAG: PTS sugar transporter subunit IIA [Candidatus Omnitrophica bacterium]|nr:PTS sugar transporter subunit IIA [Candidatus Omnitrophota bacterium]
MEKNIIDYLDKDCVILGLKQKSKKNILSAILDHLIQKKKINKADKNPILKVLLQREEMGSTAIGGYIALPHARVDCVKDVLVCFAISSEGLNFDSLDQEVVNIIALLLSNQKEAGMHLKTLAFLARMLRDKYFVQQLKNAKTEEEVLNLLNKQQQIAR